MAKMAKTLVGLHVVLLRQVTGMKAKSKKDDSWRKAASDSVLQKKGTQPLQTYIDSRQTTVADWVDLRPIFEVCAKETVYKGGGRHQEPWCQQAAAGK